MRIPSKFDLGSFYREILCIFFTFSTILKKSNLQGVFEFLHPDPQLDQNFTPARNLCGHFLIYEPTRHGPVRRAGPISPFQTASSRANTENNDFLAKKK